MTEQVLLVSPVRDEAATIERVARAIALQTRPPDVWLIVDDGSTDGTADLARRLAAQLPFARVLDSGRSGGTVADGLTQAAEIRAFNEALASVGWRRFDYVGKLDGDMELPADYLERVLCAFRGDPRLGIAGGGFSEPARGGWRRVREPAHHVPGGLKLYRRECLEEIGGLEERLGWDTIDEQEARARGYMTRALPGLTARHHRPFGSSGGPLRGCARYGAAAHAIGQPPWWVVLRALKMCRRRPLLASGAAFLCGYAAARRASRSQVRRPARRSPTEPSSPQELPCRTGS